ncbi:MAG: acyl carrier protein, partial [Alteromonadaceae bacterium]
AELQDILPDYMIPSSFTFLASMPLNAADKIDRKALPKPDGSFMVDNYVSANTDTEQVVVAIWASLLKLDINKISVTANFFELGGHSLLAIKLIVDTREKLNVELAVKDIFSFTSIRLLAQKIDDIKIFESIKMKSSQAVITSEGTL